MTFHKTVRVGRLLEDLDVFAVFVCYKHILNPKQIPGVHSPYSIVTEHWLIKLTLLLLHYE